MINRSRRYEFNLLKQSLAEIQDETMYNKPL